jgi:hypothetical protein
MVKENGLLSLISQTSALNLNLRHLFSVPEEQT